MSSSDLKMRSKSIRKRLEIRNNIRNEVQHILFANIEWQFGSVWLEEVLGFQLDHLKSSNNGVGNWFCI